MSDTFYKPLTPSFRNEINETIDNNINELRNCQNNGLVKLQISAQTVLKNFISNLPDGYLLPMERRS